MLRMNENHRKDSTIEAAAVDCGLTYDQLRLPVQLTIWVDPEEVSIEYIGGST